MMDCRLRMIRAKDLSVGVRLPVYIPSMFVGNSTHSGKNFETRAAYCHSP